MENLQAKTGFLPGVFRPRKKTDLSLTPSKEMAGPKPIPFFKRMPNGPRNHFIAMVGEFMGTFLFLSVLPWPKPSRMLTSNIVGSSPSLEPKWPTRLKQLLDPRAQTSLRDPILHSYYTSVSALASRWLSTHGSSTEYQVVSLTLP